MKYGSVSSVKTKHTSSRYINSYEEPRTTYDYKPTKTITDNGKRYSTPTTTIITTSRINNLPDDENSPPPNEPSQDDEPSAPPPKNPQYRPPMLYDASSSNDGLSLFSMIMYAFIGIFINS